MTIESILRRKGTNVTTIAEVLKRQTGSAQRILALWW